MHESTPMSNRFSNSTPAAQAARNHSNAAKTGAQAPMQRGSVPNPAQVPLNLPKMTVVPQAQDPHSYNRGGSAPMIPANKGPAVRPPQVR